MSILSKILGGESSDTDQQKLLFTTDLHGSTKTFKKFINTPSFYGIDTLLMGGDLSGKALVPIVEENDGWRVEADETRHVEDEDELREIESEVKKRGDYSERMTPERYQELKQDSELVDDLYRRLRLERLDDWAELTEDKLADADVEAYFIAGNDDHSYMTSAFEDFPVFEFVDGHVTTMRSGRELLGYGWSNPTPWDTPREKAEVDLGDDLESLAADVDDWSRAIVNIHVPPYGTEIDKAPKLDDELRPQTQGGELIRESVGSTAVREFLEEYQPLLGLHGHIHESQGKIKIGRTACFNPGSSYSQGFLNGLVVSMTDDTVEQHQFRSG